MSAGVNGTDESSNIWPADAFPHYLQSAGGDFCRNWESAFPKSDQDKESPSYDYVVKKGRLIWEAIRREADRDAKSEPLLSSFLYASILGHESFDRALAFVLANRLSNQIMLPTQLFEIFNEVLTSNAEVLDAAFEDVAVVREKDPSCCAYSSALLYFKGFHALQVHRISHALWNRGQKILAGCLQSRVSEVFGVDIHPAAKIGTGILIDHGTGVVIGETAVIGNNVSILQNVTLGGTGKEGGDRHPKIHDNVLIGASATILGNIIVGKGAQVAAGSLVLKPVPEHVMVAGSPAKVIGRVTGCPSMKMEQWCKKLETDLNLFEETEATVESQENTTVKEEEPTVVESTMDDDEAQEKWPKGADPEFHI
eukprot:g5939.t1